MQRVTNWCDANLIDNWRSEIKRLWTVRVGFFWSAVGVVFLLLSLISDELKSIIGWKTFAVLFLLVGCSVMWARLLKQPGADTE